MPRRIWLLTIVAVLLLLSSYLIRSESASGLKIGDTTITTEIANTPAERERGLSGRTSIADDEGLLFVFDVPGKYGFWMKEMSFPIDIVWISADGEIIGVEKAISPSTYPSVYYPSEEVKYVLELAQGFADRHSVRAGQTLFIGH